MRSNVYEPRRVAAYPVASPVYAGVPSVSRMPALLRYAFLVFVFTIPIESLNLSLNLGSVSLARMTGLGLFGLTLFYFRRCYSTIPKATWWFLGYLLVFVTTGLFISPVYTPYFVSQLYTTIQLIAFFWLGSNVLQDEAFSRKALLAYAWGTVFLSTAVQLGLPGFSQAVLRDSDGERYTTVGDNPNYLGMILAVGAIILVGLALQKRPRRIRFFLPVLVVLTMLVQTGSRAAILAFVVGTSCFLLPLGRKRRTFVAAFLIGLALVSLTYFIMSDPIYVGRIARTMDGDSAGRNLLFDISVDMISEHPFLGWYPIEFQHELRRRYSGTDDEFFGQDPHNMELNTLLEVGILGALPFLIGIGMCGWAAWKGRYRSLGILPLALLVALLAGFQFHSFNITKPLWFAFAVCAAANLSSSDSIRRRTVRTMPLPVRSFKPVRTV